MRDKKTNCWPPYDSRPEPDADTFGAELGNALKILDKAWDHAPDHESRDRVDRLRSDIRHIMLDSIGETAERQENNDQ